MLARERRLREARNAAQAEFDARYGTDTGGIIPLTAFHVDNPVWVHGVRYGATSFQVFRDCLAALPEHPAGFKHFTFLDIGSGKGAALLYASHYDFRQILGVELVSALHRMQSGTFLCTRLPGVAPYPSAWTPLISASDRPLILFANNPFSPGLMDRLLGAVRQGGTALSYLILNNCPYKITDLPNGRGYSSSEKPRGLMVLFLLSVGFPDLDWIGAGMVGSDV